MNKLLGIVVLSLIWCNVSFADEIAVLDCKNLKNPAKWELIVDLDKKFIKFGEFENWKIKHIEEFQIFAQHTSGGLKKTLVLDRYTGFVDLLITYTYDDKIWMKDSFVCHKLEKII